MDSWRQLAKALNGLEMRQTSEVKEVSGAFARSDPGLSQTVKIPFSHPGQSMFLEVPKRKILCLCGVIAEVDLKMAKTKMSLGKTVECRTCRNARIAREREEMERHFSGEEDLGEEW